MDWLNLSLTGNQLKVSNSFLEIWVILSSYIQYRCFVCLATMHLFCVIWILFFFHFVGNIRIPGWQCIMSWGWIRTLHNNLHSTGVKNLFFLCRILSLEFILSILEPLTLLTLFHLICNLSIVCIGVSTPPLSCQAPPPP